MKSQNNQTPTADPFYSLGQFASNPTDSPHPSAPGHSSPSLRQKAEAQFREREEMSQKKNAALSHEEMGALLHELRVHQIELEIQNDELHSQQQHLTNTVNAANVGTWEWNVQTRETAFNERWAEIIGLSLQEISPATIETWERYCHPDDLKVSGELLEKHFRGATDFYEFEGRMKHKDGSWVWVLDRGKVISWTEKGKPLVMLGAHMDITERKQATVDLQTKNEEYEAVNEELMSSVDELAAATKELQVQNRDLRQAEKALKGSEERFRNLFAEAPLGIALIDSLTGHIYEVNPMFAKIAGRTMEEMVKIDWMSITHPDDVQEDLDNMARMNAGEINGFRMEKRYLHHDGTAVWINMTIAPVRVEDYAHPRHLCMIEDITGRKQAEANIRQEQALSNSIIGSIPGTFYLLDENGRYVRWNTYQRDEILGKPDDQIAGMNAIDTIHPEDRALIQSRIANVLKDGTVEIVEGRVLLRGGPAFVWMLMTGRRMTIAGRPFLVGTGVDISERKRVVEEIRKLNTELEERVCQRTAALSAANQELESFNRVMVDREQRIIGMKEEVNALCQELGRAVFYPPVWEKETPGAEPPHPPCIPKST